MKFTQRQASGGITLNVGEAGPENGTPVILLHGFPEFWFGWRHQIGALAAAGYRVIVPDQRGYNLSDKPRGVANYDIDKLADDIVALAAHYTGEPIRLVAHDWGALAAWWTVSRHPSKVAKLVALNCPHPQVWTHAMTHDPVQRKASWYVRAFRVPVLPEWNMRRNNFSGMLGALRESTTPLSEAEAEAYRTAWRQPSALTATINWYRAVLRHKFAPIAPGSIKPPSQIVWGEKDHYALPALAHASKALCADARLTFLPEATHWVAHDAPEQVNAILLDFLP
jgi:pimeloyl-ACP methyl ester carboxylesterase